jgi:gas vesicle protein
MTYLFIGMMIGVIIGTTIGSLAVAFKSAEEIARLDKEVKDAHKQS